jgi:transcriptional regulator GlxA family with amidase domain
MRPKPLLALITTLTPVLAAPHQPPFSNTTTLPTHFGLLIFPHFQALDVFGPMDVLNTLSMLYSNSTMHLSILSSTLDPVSTAMPGMHGSGAFGESIVPTTTFSEYLAHHPPSNQGEEGDGNSDNDGPTYTPPNSQRPIDVLLVPGGAGTRQPLTSEIAFVKTLYPHLKYIISVCTGATILSRAGILDHRRATTNKRAWAWATSTGPNVTWVPTARWVEDGNVFSSSGISAGIDVAYAWVGRVYGDEVAEYLSLSSEYTRETHWDHDPYGKIWDVPGAT